MSVAGDDGVTIGQRVRALRLWRHMTLAELAGLTGVSAPYLSMAERGLRSFDRRSLISDLATALRVSEIELTGGPHLGSDPEQSAPHSAIPALRAALESTSLTDPADVRTRPVAELAAEVRAVKAAYYDRCDYVAAGELLPAVLDELHVSACPAAAEEDRAQALGLLVEAGIIALFMAKNLGYPDLAHVAALRSDEAARMLGDPVMIGKAAFARFHSTPQALESWDRSLHLAERAAGALESHARDGEAICVLGLLTLSAAFAAAVLQRPRVMEHWLGQSAALAAQVTDDMSVNWQSFCRTNVAVWRVALAVERGEAGGKVAELARTVDEGKLTTRTRRADFLVDVGRGVARDPKAAAEAVRWLRRAEETAPQRVRNCAPAREAVGSVGLTRDYAPARQAAGPPGGLRHHHLRRVRGA